MKNYITLLLLVITFQVVAQTYPITGINISLPANPDANTANWGTGTSMFTITSTSKAENGRVAPHVTESKILVTIKKGGTKVCGNNTMNTAPEANFNTLTKVWSGINAIALLGQDCVLTPGDYELCVQFFGYGPVGMDPMSEEKCKPFSIREKEQQTFQPPQVIAPTDGSVMSEADAKKPITFRWIPVIPRPQDPVTYCLTVWQLMQGQTGVQAMKVNQPLITKDVDNITQAVINNLISGPCLPPYLCDFIWNVQALNHKGKPIGENNGTSKLSQINFKIEKAIIDPEVKAGNETCKDFRVDFMEDRKIYRGDSVSNGLMEKRKIYRGDSITYECTITNNYRGDNQVNKPKSFKIKLNNDLVIAVVDNLAKGWTRTPSKFPPGSSQIKWTNNSGDIPQGETKLGTLYFAVPTSNPFYVIYEWFNREGKVICKDSIALTDNRFYYELDKEPTYTYTEISNNILRVQFFNHYASAENLKLAVYDITEEKIKRKSKDVIKLNSVTGQNRISIDIKDYNLEPGRPYLLTISDSHGTYQFNFKVTNDREK